MRYYPPTIIFYPAYGFFPAYGAFGCDPFWGWGCGGLGFGYGFGGGYGYGAFGCDPWSGLRCFAGSGCCGVKHLTYPTATNAYASPDTENLQEYGPNGDQNAPENDSKERITYRIRQFLTVRTILPRTQLTRPTRPTPCFI